MGELVLGVVMPVLLVLFTSAAARAALSGRSLGSVFGRAGVVAASPSWRWLKCCLRRDWRRGAVVDRASPP